MDEGTNHSHLCCETFFTALNPDQGCRGSRAYPGNSVPDTGIHPRWDASPVAGHHTHTRTHARLS